MKRKAATLLTILIFLISVMNVPHVYAAEGIKAQFYNGNRDTSTSSISINFNLANNGDSPVDLSTIKLRYYFTNDGTQTDNFACDYSPIGNSNVSGTFGSINAKNADEYLEVGFSSSAGTLSAGSNIVIQTRIWKSDWSSFKQTNDYSFNSSATTYVDSTSVTAYQNGSLIWGVEPASTVKPSPTDLRSKFKSDFIGYFDTSDTDGPKFAWSNTTIKANFEGTGISVNLISGGDNWFNVIIDGVVQTPINVNAGTSSPIILASGLTNSTHTIELVKRTEANVGEVQFLGFSVTDGSLLTPPEPSSRRILFIGDSITCGYGDEGTNKYESFTTKNENSYLAYGALTAKQLDADAVTVCWSGKGVLRNYGGSTADTMPEIYQRILPYSSTALWNASDWQPQVVVINLCTNDYSTGIPDETDFTDVYSAFVEDIRGKFPNADIYCAVGPMLYGDNLTSARSYINGVVTNRNTSGDEKVHYIEFVTQDAANGYGEDWHPSLITHGIMADQLTAQIKSDLGW